MCKIPSKVSTRLPSRTLSDVAREQELANSTFTYDFIDDMYAATVPEVNDYSKFANDLVAQWEAKTENVTAAAAAENWTKSAELYDLYLQQQQTPFLGSSSDEICSSDEGNFSVPEDLATTSSGSASPSNSPPAYNPSVLPTAWAMSNVASVSQQLCVPPTSVVVKHEAPTLAAVSSVIASAASPAPRSSVAPSSRPTSTSTPSTATSKSGDSKVAKRERNRLAAEKYRKKGRDLIDKLTRKCGELMHENEQLKSNLLRLDEEVKYMRDLVKSVAVTKPNAVPL